MNGPFGEAGDDVTFSMLAGDLAFRNVSDKVTSWEVGETYLDFWGLRRVASAFSKVGGGG